MISFGCESCGHHIELDDACAGKTGRCKHCGHEMAVPAPQEEPISSYGFRLKPEEPASALAPAEDEGELVAEDLGEGIALADTDLQPSRDSAMASDDEDSGIPEGLLADRVSVRIDEKPEPPPRSVNPQTPPAVTTVKAGWMHSIRSVLKQLIR
jgi:hypothetical protein